MVCYHADHGVKGEFEKMKIMLLLAAVGHLICGITDCMFAYSKAGRFDFADVGDNEKMKNVFSAMSLRQLEIGMMLGVVALFLSSAGYLAVADWMKDYSEMAATIMKYSSLFFLILIAAHHVLCGAVEWFYVRFGMSENTLRGVTEFFKKTSLLAIAYAGLLVYVITLLIMIVAGETDLPRWACILNTLPAFLVLLPTKIPAKGNVANAFMFLGLTFLL